MAVVVVIIAVLTVRRDSDETSGASRVLPAVSATTSATSLATSPDPSEPSPANDGYAGLTGDFLNFVSPVEAVVGMAAFPVGGTGPGVSLGQWQEGAAWSTSKVPLVLAALDADPDRQVTTDMQMAITHSDNTAADNVWQSLGTPEEAASKMDLVLRGYGDPTNVESRRLRGPKYSAFGQTIWSLGHQASFLAGVACSPPARPVLDLMRQVEPGQQWGLGRIAGSRFKGGWGPSLDGGRYIIRQFGLVPTESGVVAVAIGADVNSSTYDGAIPAINALANWISAHLAAFPSGNCPEQASG